MHLLDRPGDLAQIVKFHRKQSGLSQLEVAELAGVGKTVIYDIEHGKESVRLNTLYRVLKVLNLQVWVKSPLLPGGDGS